MTEILKLMVSLLCLIAGFIAVFFGDFEQATFWVALAIAAEVMHDG